MFDALEKWQIFIVVTASNICNNIYKSINNIMLKNVIIFVDKLVRITYSVLGEIPYSREAYFPLSITLYKRPFTMERRAPESIAQQ